MGIINGLSDAQQSKTGRGIINGATVPPPPPDLDALSAQLEAARQWTIAQMRGDPSFEISTGIINGAGEPEAFGNALGGAFVDAMQPQNTAQQSFRLGEIRDQNAQAESDALYSLDTGDNGMGLRLGGGVGLTYGGLRSGGDSGAGEGLDAVTNMNSGSGDINSSSNGRLVRSSVPGPLNGDGPTIVLPTVDISGQRGPWNPSQSLAYSPDENAAYFSYGRDADGPLFSNGHMNAESGEFVDDLPRRSNLSSDQLGIFRQRLDYLGDNYDRSGMWHDVKDFFGMGRPVLPPDLLKGGGGRTSSPYWPDALSLLLHRLTCQTCF